MTAGGPALTGGLTGRGQAAVAAIVPNYNKQKTLAACLRAIYAQTHPPTEVIVVDDASTDRSRHIARQFPCTLITHRTNRGPAAARNTGAATSTAPLLFFVDSDTALQPDAIANAVHALHHTPDCGMVQGIYDPHPLYDDGPVEAYRVAFEHFWRRASVGRETGTLFAASLLPRHVFAETGGFDESLRHGEDDEFGTRLPARHRLLVTDTVRTRHDDVDRLLPFLWEQFVRASTKPLVMAKAGRARRDGATGPRVALMSPGRLRHLDHGPRLSLAVTALGLAAAVLALLHPAPLLAVPAAVAAFVAVNRDFLRLARELRGPGFAAYAAALHLLSYVVLVLGAAAGVLRVAYAALRRPRWRRRAWRVAGAALLALVCAAVVRALADQDWSAVGAVLASRGGAGVVGLLAGALLAAAGGLAIGMLSWRAVLLDLGPPVGGTRVIRVFFLSFLAKYVPGKVPGLLAGLKVAQLNGVAVGRMVSAGVLSQIVTVLTGLLVGLLAGVRVLGTGAGWLALLAVPAALIALRPDLVFNRAVRLALRLFRRPPPAVEASPAGVRRAAVLQTLAWLVAGLHLWLLAVAMGAPPAPALPLCVAAFSLATAAGLVSLLAPDGIGVREAVLMAVLVTLLPVPAAAVVVVASRIVTTVGEVALAAGVLAVAELRHRRARVPQRSQPGAQPSAPATGEAT